ncbi:MAG: beta-lactamase [Firmicutes bacterium]|nr:beta-lactamase [Bacillota bacterium]
MSAAGIPGAAVAVVHQGRVAVAGFGLADLAAGTAVTADSLFPLASVTKSFTATAVMQLAEEGRIALDQPVVDYLPWFRLADTDACRRITVRMLLNHTSGLGRTRHLDPNAGASYASRRDLAEALASAQLQTMPGEAWSYSNEAYSVAGHLVDALGSLTFEEHLRERIFAPLGMAATTPDITEWLRSPHRAFGYAPGAHGVPEPVADLPIAPASLPAGRVCATAPDLARYLMAMLDGPNPVLTSRSQRQMQSPTTLWGDTAWGYGLGWFIQHGPAGTVVRHGGNQRGVANHLFMVTGERLGVAVLTNLSGAPAGHIAEQLANVTLGRPVLRGGVDEPLPVLSRYQADPGRVAAVGGTFASALGEVAATTGDGRLTLMQRLGEANAPMHMETIPIGSDLFMITRGGAEGQPVRVLRDAGGRADRLLLAGTVYNRASHHGGSV